MTPARRALSALLGLLALAPAAASGDDGWTKFVSADRSFSFHYPSGWTVDAKQSTVQIADSGADEEILIVGAPLRGTTARSVAEAMIDLFAAEIPDLRASGWRTDEARSMSAFDISYSQADTKYAGIAIVIRSAASAQWFSFSGPAKGWSRARPTAILRALIASVAEGPGSKPPDGPVPGAPVPAAGRAEKPAAGAARAARVEADLRAFLFVLEFGLGGPLTVAQERVILGEMEAGDMVRTEKGLEGLDGYPPIVNAILAMGGRDLEELRATLEKSLREWLDESDPSDVAVQAVRAQLENRGRTLVPGEPPLTEMAAQAYAEIHAFAERLAEDPGADPARLEPGHVTAVRRDLLAAWPRFDSASRGQVATCPGLWLVWRKVLAFGSEDEARALRGKIRAILPAGEAPAAGDRKGPAEAQRRWAAHQTLMQMRQATFNQYMWSRGYNYGPATGKMW